MKTQLRTLEETKGKTIEEIVIDEYALICFTDNSYIVLEANLYDGVAEIIFFCYNQNPISYLNHPLIKKIYSEKELADYYEEQDKKNKESKEKADYEVYLRLKAKFEKQ